MKVLCCFLSVGVKQEEHDALLVEVQRLEAELGKVREDLLGVVGCKGQCEQLAILHDTVSTSETPHPAFKWTQQ